MTYLISLFIIKNLSRMEILDFMSWLVSQDLESGAIHSLDEAKLLYYKDYKKVNA